ncbi:MAG: fibronectin type III domain-containing protein [Desulfobacterales bacterium]
MALKMKKTLLLFLLIPVFAVISGCENKEDYAPAPGQMIAFTNVSSDSLTVNWTRATDHETFQPYLEYKVVASLRNNIDTLDNAERNGKPMTYDDPETETKEEIVWNRDIVSLDIKGLLDGKVYYFNVIVRDESWRKAAYTMTSQKTIDITDPIIGGVITISNETSNSLELNWPQSTDNGTAQRLLEYKVVRSISNNISTVAGAETQGTEILEWKTYDQIEFPFQVTGLSPEVDFFNVIVRDEYDNKSVYLTVSQAPIPGGLGNVSVSNVGTTFCTLSWDPATDYRTSTTELEYRISGSESLQNMAWTKNISTYNIEGLNSKQNYYFIVTVRDADGYESNYNRASVLTLEDLSQSAAAIDRAMMAVEDNDGEIPMIMDADAPLSIGRDGHLLVWLDGSDITGNGDDFEGPVEIWADKSGMGNHAQQPVFDRQPVAVPMDLIHSLSAVRFDSSNQSSMVVRLGADLDSSVFSSAYTVFIAADSGRSIDDNINPTGCYFIGRDSLGNYAGLFQEAAPGDVRFVVKTSWNDLLRIPAVSSPFAASLQFGRISNENVAVFSIDGDSYSAYNFIQPETVTGFVLGASEETEGSGQDAVFIDGELFEFIVFDRRLDDSETERMHHYLNNKWGIVSAEE